MEPVLTLSGHNSGRNSVDLHKGTTNIVLRARPLHGKGRSEDISISAFVSVECMECTRAHVINCNICTHMWFKLCTTFNNYRGYLGTTARMKTCQSHHLDVIDVVHQYRRRVVTDDFDLGLPAAMCFQHGRNCSKRN